MAYGNFKNLNRRTFADKVVRDKAFNVKMFLIKNWQKNYTNQLLENLIEEKYIHDLLTIFEMQI